MAARTFLVVRYPMRTARMSHARCALFVVGPPGVGKTTLVRVLLGFPEVYTIVKPKWTISNDRTRCAAGHYFGQTFDGADQVPYNGARAALDYWKRHLSDYHKLTIFDGDRFSNNGVVYEVKATGVAVRCVHMTADDAVLSERRKERGSNQNETWMKGRETKAKNFAALFGESDLLQMSVYSDPPTMLADRVKEFVRT